MKLALTLVDVGALGLPAFAQEPKKDAPKPEAQKPAAERKLGLAKPIVFEKDNEVYGAKPSMSKALALTELMKDPKAQEGKAIRLDGEIEGVCQAKGCWLTLKDGEQSVRVKFKDYAFFVPLDVAGRAVTVEGKAEVKIVTEAMRRHYAIDAGKSKEEVEKIKGDETTVIFMADAVKVGGAPVKKDACCEGEVDASGEVKKPADGAKKEGCCGSDKDKKPADGAKKEGCCGDKAETKKEGCCGDKSDAKKG